MPGMHEPIASVVVRCDRGGSAMSDVEGDPAIPYASSQGQVFTQAGMLDTHFEAARPEYEAMLRSAGLQLGWHVLDAGCGGGSFVPLIAEAVGPTGHVTAFD